MILVDLEIVQPLSIPMNSQLEILEEKIVY